MYTLTAAIVCIIIQLSSAQTSKPLGTLSYICARTTSPTTNYIELVYNYGTNDTLKSLYVQNFYRIAGCMTQTKVTDLSNGHLILRINDLKIPVPGTPSAVCGIDLARNSAVGAGAVTPDKDIIFLFTYQDTEVFRAADFLFTIKQADCNFAAASPTTQTIKNVETISVTGLPKNTVTAVKTVENLQLLVLKEGATANTYDIAKSLSLGDKVKIRVDMKLPARGANSAKLRVKSLTAYETCAKTSTAVDLVMDYCAKPQLGMTDDKVGFINSATTSMFTATLSKPFSAFMYGSSQTLCFSADVDFCASSDAKCADGDTCASKTARRRRRAIDNSTNTATVSTAVVVTYDKQQTASPVKDCGMFVHPKVFFPILTVLLLLLIASVATTIYVVCHTKRRMGELQIKKLDENL